MKYLIQRREGAKTQRIEFRSIINAMIEIFVRCAPSRENVSDYSLSCFVENLIRLFCVFIAIFNPYRDRQGAIDKALPQRRRGPLPDGRGTDCDAFRKQR
ncbi:hypothetical protein JXA32_01430 [Candidatus Sumerlaeota bacterium]|nr:hypothetical protein [Candidatus Sumerlaeota bacterium]